MSIADIVLASGRDISLTSLEVSAGGKWLEGYPSARWNDLSLAAVMHGLAERFPHAGTFLVDPPRSQPEPPDASHGSFGPLEILPPIRCTGVFASHPIADDADPMMVESSLVVAWYQDHPVLPIDEYNHRLLRSMDWNALARDHER